MIKRPIAANIATNNIFVESPQTFLSPIFALEELVPLEDNSTEVNIPIDVSEDILDEGIATGPEVVEEVVLPEVPVIEEAVVPVWIGNGNIATTNDVIVLGEVYTAPQNGAVSLTFTKLPQESGFLTINEITLTNEEIEATGSVSDVAYDITTDMVDGTYEYDLTLPTTSDDVSVVYAESREDILSNTKEINEQLTIENGLIEIEGLDHFTVFVVVNPNLDGNGNTCTVASITGTCYDTIQQAVNMASDGDDIYIHSGTHTVTTQLVINKDLDIIGAGQGLTIIAPGFNTGSSGDSRGWVLINNDAEVSFTGITFDGAGNRELV